MSDQGSDLQVTTDESHARPDGGAVHHHETVETRPHAAVHAAWGVRFRRAPEHPVPRGETIQGINEQQLNERESDEKGKEEDYR